MIPALLEEEFAVGADQRPYVDDVFSAYPYVGTGSALPIVNGIDLAGKGGMVWIKGRSQEYSHTLHDTLRGRAGYLRTNGTDPQVVPLLSSFNSNGFTIDPPDYQNYSANQNGVTFTSWTFRQAPKFFTQKLVTHTVGVNQTVDLSELGTVGFVLLKNIDTNEEWTALHRSLSAGKKLVINSVVAAQATSAAISATSVTVPGAFSSGRYIIYAWAHDPSPEGLIQCGSYVGNGVNGRGGPTVTLGWEPQFLMVKCASATDTYTNWMMLDSMRGMGTYGTNTNYLYANQSFNENYYSNESFVEITATNFALNYTSSSANASLNASGQTYIYMAIRRPNKPASLLGASKVFTPFNGTGQLTKRTTPHTVDMAMFKQRTLANDWSVFSRITGGRYFSTTTIAAETANANGMQLDYADGFRFPTEAYFVNGGAADIAFALKRAPVFFDQVCYDGNSVAGRQVLHSLGSPPIMMWIKNRSSASWWTPVYHRDIGAAKALWINQASAATDANYTGTDQNNLWSIAAPTAATFSVGGSGAVNATGNSYMAALFGEAPGISKAGAFTLGASTLNIDLGFTPRFFMCKRTDAAGDWYMWDSARGIVAANDPVLLLNSTAAEVTTTDHVDPILNGIAVNPTLSAGTYIYYAIA
ncbi:hypothetical protein M5E06_20875 [Azospirillum sp. A1-3]|uniref:DUF7483 domain-containing protein n=1 Tax=Azospirillum sp. A1-3 TaxID=185874 RepID=UPI002077330C|nr:hypothetical protein [Azospirillum sp. A1-3]MCM8736584.1 hypothetical protein [Azospirillum sp. A1-3]